MPRTDARVQVKSLFTTATDTVTAGAGSSAGIDKRGWRAKGVILPTMTSASVAFAVSSDNSTWVNLQEPPGTAIGYAATSGSCAVSGSLFDLLEPWPYARLTYGAAQASAQTVTWVLVG